MAESSALGPPDLQKPEGEHFESTNHLDAKYVKDSKSLSYIKRAELAKEVITKKRKFHDNAKQMVRSWQMRMLRVIEVQRP